MKKEDFEFAEGDEPLIKVRVTRRNPTTGKREPYPLVGTTTTMLIKLNAETPDDDATVIKYDMDNAVTYDEPNGLILIQTGIGAGAIGRRVYVVRLYQGPHPRTLLYGAWKVLNI